LAQAVLAQDTVCALLGRCTHRRTDGPDGKEEMALAGADDCADTATPPGGDGACGGGDRKPRRTSARVRGTPTLPILAGVAVALLQVGVGMALLVRSLRGLMATSGEFRDLATLNDLAVLLLVAGPPVVVGGLLVAEAKKRRAGVAAAWPAAPVALPDEERRPLKNAPASADPTCPVTFADDVKLSDAEPPTRDLHHLPPPASVAAGARCQAICVDRGIVDVDTAGGEIPPPFASPSGGGGGGHGGASTEDELRTLLVRLLARSRSVGWSHGPFEELTQAQADVLQRHLSTLTPYVEKIVLALTFAERFPFPSRQTACAPAFSSDGRTRPKSLSNTMWANGASGRRLDVDEHSSPTSFGGQVLQRAGAAQQAERRSEHQQLAEAAQQLRGLQPAKRASSQPPHTQRRVMELSDDEILNLYRSAQDEAQMEADWRGITGPLAPEGPDDESIAGWSVSTLGLGPSVSARPTSSAQSSERDYLRLISSALRDAHHRDVIVASELAAGPPTGTVCCYRGEGSRLLPTTDASVRTPVSADVQSGPPQLPELASLSWDVADAPGRQGFSELAGKRVPSPPLQQV